MRIRFLLAFFLCVLLTGQSLWAADQNTPKFWIVCFKTDRNPEAGASRAEVIRFLQDRCTHSIGALPTNIKLNITSLWIANAAVIKASAAEVWSEFKIT